MSARSGGIKARKRPPRLWLKFADGSDLLVNGLTCFTHKPFQPVSLQGREVIYQDLARLFTLPYFVLDPNCSRIFDEMLGDNNSDLERNGREAQMDTKPARSPLGLFKGSVESLTRCLSRSSKESKPASEASGKKYVHTPTHAATSHLKTTRSRNMDRANDVL